MANSKKAELKPVAQPVPEAKAKADERAWPRTADEARDALSDMHWLSEMLAGDSTVLIDLLVRTHAHPLTSVDFFVLFCAENGEVDTNRNGKVV
jgi:hypothetical protein